jgi:hypothetical protein
VFYQLVYELSDSIQQSIAFGWEEDGKMWFTELALGALVTLAISTHSCRQLLEPSLSAFRPHSTIFNNCEREGGGYIVVLRTYFQSSWCT